MTAKVSSINGVTLLHSFEFEFDQMEWKGTSAHGCAEASTLGFKPGQWPDSFKMMPFGTFKFAGCRQGGTHVYMCDRHTFTIFND